MSALVSSTDGFATIRQCLSVQTCDEETRYEQYYSQVCQRTSNPSGMVLSSKKNTSTNTKTYPSPLHNNQPIPPKWRHTYRLIERAQCDLSCSLPQPKILYYPLVEQIIRIYGLFNGDIIERVDAARWTIVQVLPLVQHRWSQETFLLPTCPVLDSLKTRHTTTINGHIHH